VISDLHVQHAIDDAMHVERLARACLIGGKDYTERSSCDG
jgi:hypothetical protein